VLLTHLGRDHIAAVLARYVLRAPDCPERSRIEAALESIGPPPDGWQEAVLAFAAAPSLGAREQLMQFAPDDFFYHRERNTLQTLTGLGVDRDILFQCATRYASSKPQTAATASGSLASGPTAPSRCSSSARTFLLLLVRAIEC